MKRFCLCMLFLGVLFIAACGMKSGMLDKEEFITMKKDETNNNVEDVQEIGENIYKMFPKGMNPTCYEYIDRSLTLNDFTNIKLGMTLKEIEEIIGEPNGLCGWGIVSPYYQLSDGSCIVLWIGFEESSVLTSIRILDMSGRVFAYPS